MSSIDTSRKFISINIGLITISDTRSLEDDRSGDLLNNLITTFGHYVKNRQIIKTKSSNFREMPSNESFNAVKWYAICVKVLSTSLPIGSTYIPLTLAKAHLAL